MYKSDHLSWNEFNWLIKTEQLKKGLDSESEMSKLPAHQFPFHLLNQNRSLNNRKCSTTFQQQQQQQQEQQLQEQQQQQSQRCLR